MLRICMITAMSLSLAATALAQQETQRELSGEISGQFIVPETEDTQSHLIIRVIPDDSKTWGDEAFVDMGTPEKNSMRELRTGNRISATGYRDTTAGFDVLVAEETNIGADSPQQQQAREQSIESAPNTPQQRLQDRIQAQLEQQRQQAAIEDETQQRSREDTEVMEQEDSADVSRRAQASDEQEPQRGTSTKRAAIDQRLQDRIEEIQQQQAPSETSTAQKSQQQASEQSAETAPNTPQQRLQDRIQAQLEQQRQQEDDMSFDDETQQRSREDTETLDRDDSADISRRAQASDEQEPRRGTSTKRAAIDQRLQDRIEEIQQQQASSETSTAQKSQAEPFAQDDPSFWGESQQQTARTVHGTVDSIKDYSIEGDDRRFMKLRSDKSGETWIVDLGSAQTLDRLDLQSGDRVMIEGQPARLNDRPVIRATQLAHFIPLNQDAQAKNLPEERASSQQERR